MNAPVQDPEVLPDPTVTGVVAIAIGVPGVVKKPASPVYDEVTFEMRIVSEALVKLVPTATREAGVPVDPVLTFAVTVVVAEPGMDTVEGLVAGKSMTALPRVNSAMEVTSALRLTEPVDESPKATPVPTRVIARIAKRVILLFIPFPPWK